MTFDERRDRALALMAQTDVPPARYAPPFYRWLWRRGLPIPPPHFDAKAWPTILWVPLFLSLTLPNDALHSPLGLFLLVSIGVGMLARLTVGRRYAREAERLDLPAWEELGPLDERRRPGSILGLDEDDRDDRR
jgi:Family of unknown function (DUF6404)